MNSKEHGVHIGAKTLHRDAGFAGATTSAGAEEMGALPKVAREWSRADIGASILSDWENKALSKLCVNSLLGS